MTAPSILLLHGAALGGWMWQPSVRRLRESHEVFTPDLPGHLGSREPHFTTNAAAADLLAGSIGQGPVTVVGFSIGGQIAMELAARHPSLVDRLVVVSSLTTPGLSPAFMAGLMRVTRPLAHSRRFARAQARASLIPESQFENYWRSSTSLSADSLAAIGRENFDYRTPSTWGSTSLPTLLIAGSEEPRQLLAGMRALHSSRVGSELEIVDGAGHGVPLERPDWFGDRLARFIAGTAANMQ